MQLEDLPDADIRPPDNVLFVCKLNPVTTDEDLELIFSRFGPCIAEIIRVCFYFFRFRCCASFLLSIVVDFSISFCQKK